MTAAYVTATIVAVVANGYAATMDAVRPAWLLDNMARLDIPRSRLPLLGGLKAAGAAGLLVGLALPAVGVAAGAGLVLFFLGAVATVLRSGWYGHLPYPAAFLAIATAAFALRLASL
ncbi:MAG TPA: DoxX family protein [Acidimicrobiales bacterium]